MYSFFSCVHMCEFLSMCLAIYIYIYIFGSK